jgi:hypothetical protein
VMLPPPPVSAPPAGAAEVVMGDGLGEAATAGWAVAVAVAMTSAGALVTHVGVAQAGAWVAHVWPGAPQDCVGGTHPGADCCWVHVGAGVGGGVEHWHCPPYPGAGESTAACAAVPVSMTAAAPTAKQPASTPIRNPIFPLLLAGPLLRGQRF